MKLVSLRTTAHATAIALGATLFAMPAAADTIFVEVNNLTDYDVMELYVSPVTSDEWGDDILGEDIFPAGDAMEIEIDSAVSCIYDIAAVFEDGDELTLQEDLCEMESLDFVTE